jgi:hypothetical protein
LIFRNAVFQFLSDHCAVMKNKSALLLGPLLFFISCNLHDTSYLQAGDPNGRGGRAGSDSGGSGATGASAGADDTIGGSGEGGSGEGGSKEGGSGEGGSGEGGDRSMAGSADGGSDLGGAGGARHCDSPVQCESSDMIADFESNDGHLCVESSGTVIAYGDGTGTQSPEVGDVREYDASDDCDRGSLYALHALGIGAKDYGFGVALRFPQNVDAVAAGYTGIRFKAKAAKPKTKISIKVAIPATLDASFGGSCEPTAAPKKDCNDHPAASVLIATGGWLTYEVPFTMLKQEGWGVPATPSYEAVAQVHVIFPGPISGGSADFDVWLDDIEFYK